MARQRLTIGLAAVAALGLLAALFGRQFVYRLAVEYFSSDYGPPGSEGAADVLPSQSAAALPAVADDEDAGVPLARPAVAIVLEKVAGDLEHPVDIQFVPGHPRLVAIAEKAGALKLLDLAGGGRRTLLSLKVRTASEEGLLGVAFHPRFADNGLFYVSYVAGELTRHETRIDAYRHPSPAEPMGGEARRLKTLLSLEQPYQNHNGGQILFGPDGYLYVGLGDGGLRGDPERNGQNRGTLLGAILRIDVDHPGDGRPYGIPGDNPFVGEPGAAPEIWAYGLRNPWRFSFTADGRILAGDVGQDAFEEIDLITKGDNLGWRVREGFSCYDGHPRCGERFVEPIHAYGRDVGTSVTGGLVYRGSRIPGLRGRYVFADFTTGRFFALEVPKRAGRPEVPAGGLPAIEIGSWPVLPSAFGRDTGGELYVAAFGHGSLFRLAPAAAGTGPEAAP